MQQIQKGWLIFILCTVPCLNGCVEGGPFFTGVGDFIDKEADRGTHFVPIIQRYADIEKEKPAEVADNFRRHKTKEKLLGSDLKADIGRYWNIERDRRPKLSEMSPRGSTQQKKKPYFPPAEEY